VTRAFTQTISIAIVIAIVVAAFAGYFVGYASQKEPISTRASAETITTYVLIPTTLMSTTTVVQTPPGEHVITLTEEVTRYGTETYTVVIYPLSETTYRCLVGTAQIVFANATTSLRPVENVSGTFVGTATTVNSMSVVSTTTETITSSYPLTSYVSTSGGSTFTTTTCLAES
jgi:uncharacterized membrane protein